MAATAIAITLPTGFWLDRRHHRSIGLRAVTERDDVFLAETAGDPVVARRTTAVLGRCLVTDEGLPEPTALAGRLTAGDREALLLHLRRLTFGDAMTAIARCADPACAETFEVDLRTSDLLVPPYPRPRAEYTVTIDDDGPRRVRFRLPNGDDQEAAATAAADDPATGARIILERCVAGVDAAGRSVAVASGLTPGAVSAVETAMAERDPQAEIELELVCPVCGLGTTALFDTGAYLLSELDRRIERRLSEVHLLATAYHWSEADILALPTARRQRYLELVTGIAVAAS